MQIFKNPQNLTSRGISLLEVLLAITIIATIAITSTRYYTTARENLLITEAVNVINNVIHASFKWVEGQNDFSQLTNIKVLVNAGLLPNNYDDNNGSIVNPWKGNLNVTSENGQSIKIVLTNVPQDSCNNLKTKIKNVNAESVACSSSTSDNRTTFSATWTQN